MMQSPWDGTSLLTVFDEEAVSLHVLAVPAHVADGCVPAIPQAGILPSIQLGFLLALAQFPRVLLRRTTEASGCHL